MVATALHGIIQCSSRISCLGRVCVCMCVRAHVCVCHVHVRVCHKVSVCGVARWGGLECISVLL